ncbi:MAG: hypothetical protein A3D10_06965 [Omnitrophica WOR_2 bacterium RIFCSPHIGHO2_02_FULL_48_11]|nr:MAG: hypothetical protein A3D10_06965 [Omnitrophica WOR_2 bacterium RIFCSPHIGHO2_02_FULL_48_11]
MKKFLSPIILLSFSILSLSCGYSTNLLLASGVRTIHVENIKNSIDYTRENTDDIYVPLLEVKVRNAIIDRFLFDGHLKVAPPDKADVILQGELIGYDRSVLRRTDNDDVEEYRIRVTINVVLRDRVKDEILWQENSFSGEGDYFVAGPLAKSESVAINDAIIDLGRRVVERSIENW